ncbi:MAG TPA: Maf family protein, partial [Cerasibacillus sp.]|uniref:Maf family protein n=1 Tax=Cerasibacillus sp. TaxID=2498711 RepID=UPI002F4221F9
MLQTDKKWIIASQSPRRKEIFGMLELPFEIVVSNTEEGGRQTDESVENYAMRLASDKAEAV